MEPDDLREWARRAQGIVAAPAEVTCGQRTLDYFICSQILSGFVQDVRAVLGTPISTHVPVALRLRGLHRQATVTRPMAPEGFPLQLPPPSRVAPREVCEDEWPWAEGTLPWDLEAAIEVWFHHAEDYLCHLHDIYERRRGRACGLGTHPVGSGPIESRWCRNGAASSRRAPPWSSGGGLRCTPQCGARATCGRSWWAVAGSATPA